MSDDGGVYNLKPYWKKRISTKTSQWSDSHPKYYRLIAKILTKTLGDMSPSTLLDVGCGAGSLFPIFKDIPEVHGVDFIQRAIDLSEKRVKKGGYANIKLHVMDVGDLSFFERSYFDVVLTCNFLLHIRSSMIQQVIGELARVSRKYVVCIEYWLPQPPLKRSEHSFLHNYHKLFGEKGMRLSSHISLQGYNQMLFVFEKAIE